MADNTTADLGYNVYLDRSIGATPDSEIGAIQAGGTMIGTGDSQSVGQTLSGNFVAYSGKIGGTDNYWNISQGDFAAIGTADVAIRAAQTDYNTGTGFWLGRKFGTPKFSIGDGGISQYLTWDGTNLTVNGRTFSSEFTYGDGSDGAVVLGAGTTTLSRDMFYTNLTVPVGATLATAAFRIFCTGTFTLAGTVNNGGTGSVDAGGIGSPGNDASGSTAGTGATQAGSSFNSGSVWYGAIYSQNGAAGGNGGAGDTGAGAGAGSNGSSNVTAYNHGGSLGTNGVAGALGASGGAGGTTGSGGGAGGSGGASTTQPLAYTSLSSPRNLFNLITNLSTNDSNNTVFLFTPGGLGGPGSGGGGGGGGGWIAGTGGTILICANNMILKSTAVLSSKGVHGFQGGKGGKGAAGSGGNAAGGGGGGGGGGSAGGCGGLIFLLYTNLTNSGATFTLTGGSGGAGGVGGAGGAGAGTGATGTTGSTGAAGAGGATGQYFLFQQI